MKLRPLAWFFATTSVLFAAFSCGGDDGGSSTAPQTAGITEKCKDVDCGDHGKCAVDTNESPVCVCDQGYHADGLSCVADEAANDPCQDVDCGAHGSCAVDKDGKAVCVCDQGYYAENLKCMPDPKPSNPCSGVTGCAPHGLCAVDEKGEAVCACEKGYHPVEGKLECAKDSNDPCDGITCGANAECDAGQCHCKPGYNDQAKPGTCVPNTCGSDNHVIETVKGNFYDFVKNIDYLPEYSNNTNKNEKYIVPPDDSTHPYVTEFKKAVAALIRGDVCTAEAHANKADMKLFKYVDTRPNLPSPSLFTNEYICLMGKDEPNDKDHDPSYYRGLFCMRNYIETKTYTRNVHVAIPHPLHDGNTNLEGAEVFEMSGARYFSLSTTHRCGSHDASDCSAASSTRICKENYHKYRKSDMAHNSDSLFYFFATQVQDLDTSFHFQIHGFAADSHPNRVAITSFGSATVKAKSSRVIRRFTDTLNGLIKSVDSNRQAVSCNDSTVPSKLIKLCATTNTIGRYINGVVNGSASCTNDGVSFAHSRFIHLEQTRWLRGQGTSASNNHFALVTQAVEQTFPAVKVLQH